MRIGIRWGLATGEIRNTLLLVLVAVAILIPGGDGALGQRSTRTTAQTPLFTAIDLTPGGFTDAHAWGISQGQQVGDGGGPATGGLHALLWRGNAASVVDLNPTVFGSSEAHGICGGEQVGFGSGSAMGGNEHALLWRGGAASVVDLHPQGFDSSGIQGTSGHQQVGYGSGPTTGATSTHCCGAAARPALSTCTHAGLSFL